MASLLLRIKVSLPWLKVFHIPETTSSGIELATYENIIQSIDMS